MTDQDDYDRIAEALWQEYGEGIKDRASFDAKFDDYLDPNENQEKLREPTWKQYIKDHPVVGHMEKELPSGPRKRKVRREHKKPAKKEHHYTRTGYIRNRLVYAYKSHVTINGHRIVKWRDSRGMFVRIREKKA